MPFRKSCTGMLDNGYAREFADRTFRQLEGFGSYGFPESHAASFALIAYASSWMKCHHPDVFLAAILNAQPMGFYAPAQLVRDAGEHGVEVRAVEINQSAWDCTLERTEGRFHAVRLGFCMVRGLAKKDAERIVAIRAKRPYASVEDLWRRGNVPVASLDGIARADGFRGLGLSRREAVWAIKGLRDEALPLFAAADARDGLLRPEATEPAVALTPMTMGREVVEDYRTKGLSLRAHPLAFLRQTLQARKYLRCTALQEAADGRRISIAGLVLVRQMPGSAKGVMFITLEDEAGTGNLIVWPSVFEKNRRTILSASMLGCRGKVQRASGVIHLIVEQVIDLTADLKTVSGLDALIPGKSDEAKHGGHGPDSRDPKPMAKPRDLYVPDLHIDTLKLKARNFR
jgi:error-prone DNA polymerase